MHDAARQALLVPGGAVVVEFEGRRKNGETFPVEASFSGWQGADGFSMERSCATSRCASARPSASGISPNMIR